MLTTRDDFPDFSPGDAGAGKLIAVWGPTGAPGRTTLAVNLATELADLKVRTLLADADVYGGVVAQVLGFLDEAPGLAAAARLANNGQLDVPALAGVAVVAGPDLRVLTGISRADRWPELRPAALEQVWALARSLAAVTVVGLFDFYPWTASAGRTWAWILLGLWVVAYRVALEAIPDGEPAPAPDV